jgi:hypothetical protein
MLRFQYEYYAIFWKTFPHALDVHAQRVLTYNFILIYDFTIIENGRFKMMLKKIAKIKNSNNFMMRHSVDFKYGIQ